MNDTIFALSSGYGKSGVAVIRVSGNDLKGLFASFFAPALAAGIIPRHAYLCELRDNTGQMVDICIAIYFESPCSFTGQDVIEIHCHGSTAVIQKIFEVLKSYDCRMATPGEFTRRAFANEKMDLVEVDGLTALLDARTDRQRAAAMRTTAGVDSKIYENWRAQMVEITALSSAMIDYPEDDLPKNIAEQIKSKTQNLYNELSAALEHSGRMRAVQSGFNIALVGNVNAGKSSLFNRIIGESRAIVSDIPGTTRDVVTAEIDIDGYLVRLSDTAGLRDTTDIIENMGIERTKNTIENADLVINIQCADSPLLANEWCAKRDGTVEINVYNKSDLIKNQNNKNAIYVSALTGNGIENLLEIIKSRVHELLDGTESDIVINERTHELLLRAADELSNVIADINSDLTAEHIRAAADAIGQILGTIGIDELSDAIFGKLCLGK